MITLLLLLQLASSLAAVPNPPTRPDPALTPGAINPAVTQATLSTTACRAGYTKTIRPPVSYTNTLKQQQMTYWHLPGPPNAYEEDHRIPLEIGGHPTDPKNLWPQPWTGPWNAHDKDRLENRIHAALCAGRLTLAAAQTVFLGNWTIAYTNYFGANGIQVTPVR